MTGIIHTREPAHILHFLHINHGNATTTAHTGDEHIMVVGGEHRATQQIAAIAVAVHLCGHTQIEFELIIHHHALHIVPIVGIRARNVENAHRIVAPVRNGKVLATVSGSHHLGERSGFKHLDDGIGARVNHRNGRGVLRIDVVTAAIVGNPQVAATVRKSALHRSAPEGVEVLLIRIVVEREKSTLLRPKIGVGVGELMMNHRQFLVCACIIHHRAAALQRIDVVFLAVGVKMHRLWRPHISVAQLWLHAAVVQLLPHHFQRDRAISRLRHIAYSGMANRRYILVLLCAHRKSHTGGYHTA